MFPTTANFRTAISTNHTVISKAEVWATDQKLSEIDIESGAVEISTSNAIRRSCKVNLITDRTNNNLVPDNQFDLLNPFGNELRLYRGVRFADGTNEYVPLGVFVITDVTISDTNDGVSIEVSGEDRSLIISRNKWTAPYQLVTGTLESSITALLSNRYLMFVHLSLQLM